MQAAVPGGHAGAAHCAGKRRGTPVVSIGMTAGAGHEDKISVPGLLKIGMTAGAGPRRDPPRRCQAKETE